MAPPTIILVPSSVRPQESLQNLPIKLSTNTSVTSISDNWKPEPCAGNGDVTEAHLRGRLLQGCKVDLPAGFTGLLVRSSGQQTSSDECERQWTAAAAFHSYVAWGHDAAPGPTDPSRRALDWCSLSAQMHQPVSLAEVDAALREVQQATALGASGPPHEGRKAT